jgi:PilZ domain
VNRRKSETERRTWSRLPIAIPVFVRTKDESGQEFLEFASALNISAGGALIAVRRSPPLYSTVSLEIPSAPLASVASSNVDSRNMRAEAISHAEDYHLVALKFLTPFPTDCLDDAPPKRKVRFTGVKSFSYAEVVK